MQLGSSECMHLVILSRNTYRVPRICKTRCAKYIASEVRQAQSLPSKLYRLVGRYIKKVQLMPGNVHIGMDSLRGKIQ